MISPSQLMWARNGAGVLGLLIINQAVGIWRLRRRAAKGLNWPSADGVILTSSMEENPHDAESDDERCSVSISYSYAVAGKTYKGERIRWGGRTITAREAAEALVGKYPAGAHVRVFYDPQRPGSALLEPRDNSNVAAIAVFLGVFCVIEIGLLPLAITGSNPTAANGLPFFGFFLPLAAIGVSIGGVVSYLQTRRKAAASLRWPKVSGSIVASDIAIVREREEGASDDTRIREITKYRPAIRYTYRVGQRDYASTAVSLDWDRLYGVQSDAEAMISKYPVGAQVSVFYDPASPNVALLELNKGRAPITSLIFAAIFGVGGGIFLWAFSTLQWH
jgi:hypothetical protein